MTISPGAGYMVGCCCCYCCCNLLFFFAECTGKFSFSPATGCSQLSQKNEYGVMIGKKKKGKKKKKKENKRKKKPSQGQKWKRACKKRY